MERNKVEFRGWVDVEMILKTKTSSFKKSVTTLMEIYIDLKAICVTNVAAAAPSGVESVVSSAGVRFSYYYQHH